MEIARTNKCQIIGETTRFCSLIENDNVIQKKAHLSNAGDAIRPYRKFFKITLKFGENYKIYYSRNQQEWQIRK